MQILQGQEAEAMWALGRDFLSTSTVYKGWKDNMCRGGKLLLFCDSLLKSTVKIGQTARCLHFSDEEAEAKGC